MTKVGIVMGSDSDMPVMAKAADILEKLGVEYGCTSSGYVRSYIPDAGHWHSDAYHFSWRKRFPVFYRTDAIRHPGSYGSN